MATIQIINQSNIGDGVYLELATEKKSAFFSCNFKIGLITIFVNNASHQAWMGMGRTFWSFEKAKEAYKSSDMKAMIAYVEEISLQSA